MEIGKGENVTILFRNFRKGNEINETMPSGEVLLNGIVIPFVLRIRRKGKLKKMQEETVADLVAIEDEIRATVFTERGYKDVMLKTQYFTIFIYVKAEMVEKLFSAIR